MMLHRCLALLLAVASFTISFQLPYGALWVSLTSATVLATSARWPLLAFAWVAMAIPALDLTPWTGRFYVNEFDAWIMAAIGGAMWTTPFRRRWCLSWLDAAILVLVAVSYAFGVWITFSETASLPEGYWNPYDSPFNALRLAKPMAYAAGLLVLLTSLPSPPKSAAFAFAAGTGVGILQTFIAVALERHRFCGLLATEVDFRPTGPFADMHVGGAYLDAYVVGAAPLLLLVYQSTRSFFLRAACLVAAIGAAYSIFATLSRAPVIVAALQVGFLVAAWLISTRFRSWKAWMCATCLTTAAAAGLATVVWAPAFHARFESTAPDATIRLDHWRHCLSLVADSPFHQGLGMGSGRIPHFLRTSALGDRARNYRMTSDAEGPQLDVIRTQPLYLAQYVDVRPETEYQLKLRARRHTESDKLEIGIYEKCLLQSYDFVQFGRFLDKAPPGEWVVESSRVSSRTVGSLIESTRLPAASISRPVVLSFAGSTNAPIEIDWLRLTGPDGRELIRNGDFSAGNDYWWWSADDHLNWHAKNLAVHLLVEQGWLGLSAFALLTLRCLWLIGVALRAADPTAAPMACALIGLLGIGVIDSVIDSPRLALYYYLLCVFVLLSYGSAPKSHFVEESVGSSA